MYNVPYPIYAHMLLYYDIYITHIVIINSGGIIIVEHTRPPAPIVKKRINHRTISTTAEYSNTLGRLK